MGLLNYTYKEFTQKLTYLGFIKDREAKGSHVLWKHEELDIVVTIPFHGSKSISKGIVKDVINKLGYTTQEFHDI